MKNIIFFIFIIFFIPSVMAQKASMYNQFVFNKAGLNPAIFEATVAAKLPAEPIPGSDEIALGIPPTGYDIAAG